jgi:hypothetical protein
MQAEILSKEYFVLSKKIKKAINSHPLVTKNNLDLINVIGVFLHTLFVVVHGES